MLLCVYIFYYTIHNIRKNNNTLTLKQLFIVFNVPPLPHTFKQLKIKLIKWDEFLTYVYLDLYVEIHISMILCNNLGEIRRGKTQKKVFLSACLNKLLLIDRSIFYCYFIKTKQVRNKRQMGIITREKSDFIVGSGKGCTLYKSFGKFIYQTFVYLSLIHI